MPENSWVFRIGFFWKFFFFFSLGVFALVNTNRYINIVFDGIILFILWYIGFVKERRKMLGFVVFSTLLLTVMRLCFSRIPGDIIYFTFPRQTFISDGTFTQILLTISKWILLLTSGMLWMSVTSEDELISSMLEKNANRKVIFTISIAFNTLSFVLKDIDTITYAYNARMPKTTTLIGKTRKTFLISKTAFLSNLKRIENLNNTYYLRKNEFNEHVQYKH